MKLRISLVFLFVAFVNFGQESTLILPKLFANHMVLQQQDRVAFWGEAKPNTKVKVQGSWGNLSEILVNRTGHWFLQLATPSAGGPFIVEISNEGEKKSFSDVWIGEVWLASGQSNMEMPLKGFTNEPIQNAPEEIAQADFPQIRFFTVQRNFASDPVDTVQGKWEVCQPNTAENFSASAYFFARELHQRLQVPVGIIHSSWGGTPMEAWTSRKTLESEGLFSDVLIKMEEASPQKAQEAWLNSFNSFPYPRQQEAWEQISFEEEKAYQTRFKDKKWDTIQLPGRFDWISSKDFNGALVIRKSFEVKNPEQSFTLFLGQVDDMDKVFVNGQKIGGMTGLGKVGKERMYSLPAGLLKKGKNVIAIQLIDIAGPGTLTGDMEIRSNQNENISLKGTWKVRVVAEFFNGKFYVYPLKTDLSKRPKLLQLYPNYPSVLFNGMIAPLLPYTIKGSIWYQGEANVGRGNEYAQLFPAFIHDWRERWMKNFPFYYVQIAPFGYSTNGNPNSDLSAEIRDIQRRTLQVENTGMAVTIDLGDFESIHPGNKQEVGRRLALHALSNNYGFANLSCTGPLFDHTKVEGNELIVYFKNANGLFALDGEVIGFELAEENGEFMLADAVIKGNTVVVTHPNINHPKYVRYGWKDYPNASLYDGSDLPASPFTNLFPYPSN